ncbi:MAG: rhodanese-like domain-containing protein [Bdellovibrionia bacterium]
MKKFSTILSVFALLAFSSATAHAAADASECNKESHYPLITKSELKQVVESKSATIFDVNSKDSYESTHVPGAVHFGSHESDFAKMLPKDKGAMIVAYCGGPSCTAWKMAAKEACKLGYTNIRHFKEGIKGWNESK